jgi:hypothetical protein
VTFALQNRLDISERKIQVHEQSLKSLAQERDSAISQLGIAYLNTRELKTEVEILKAENTKLRAKLSEYVPISRYLFGPNQPEEDSTMDAYQENAPTDANGRTATATQNTNSEHVPTEPPREDTQTRISTQIDREMAKLDKQRQYEELFCLDDSLPTHHVENNRAAVKAASTATRKEPNTGKQRVKKVTVEDVDTTDHTDMNYDKRTDTSHRAATTTSQDVTFLSLMDVSST